MAERDAFDTLYGRLAATRLLEGSPPPAGRAPASHADLSSPLRWAASGLLPRMQALAPHRRLARPRPRDLD